MNQQQVRTVTIFYSFFIFTLFRVTVRYLKRSVLISLFFISINNNKQQRKIRKRMFNRPLFFEVASFIFKLLPVNIIGGERIVMIFVQCLAL